MRSYDADGHAQVVRIGSLYSGIGGLDVGLLAAFAEAGIPAKTWWMCEIEPFCRRVLAARFAPEHGIFGDVATLHEPPRVDVLCGGFICTDVSSAGRGAGLGKDTRSGHTLHHLLRIVDEITPPYLVIENVASGAKRWLPTVVRELRGRGYRPRAIPIGAVDVGAPHRRLRVFVVADRDDERQQGVGRRRVLDGIRSALGHDAHRCGDGSARQGVADAREGRRGPRGSVEEHARQPDAGQRGAVPDALGGELRQQPWWRSGPDGSGAREPGVDGAHMGDAAISRRARPHGTVGAAGERGQALVAERSGDAASNGRTPQPGVGASALRLPFDVAGCTFPAARGEEQYDWEAPRAVSKEVVVPERPAKLRATGNCVVPQCALVVGRILIDVMRGTLPG